MFIMIQNEVLLCRFGRFVMFILKIFDISVVGISSVVRIESVIRLWFICFDICEVIFFCSSLVCLQMVFMVECSLLSLFSVWVRFFSVLCGIQVGCNCWNCVRMWCFGVMKWCSLVSWWWMLESLVWFLVWWFESIENLMLLILLLSLFRCVLKLLVRQCSSLVKRFMGLLKLLLLSIFWCSMLVEISGWVCSVNRCV